MVNVNRETAQTHRKKAPRKARFCLREACYKTNEGKILLYYALYGRVVEL